MYKLAIIVQIIAILFCAIGTFSLYSRIDKATSKNLLASSVFATIYGVGYLMEMLANNEGSAQYALITQYIGLSFVALFFTIYTTELFHFFIIPKHIWVAIFSFNLATFIAVLTSPYHNYYYKTQVFVQTGLFPHLECEYTPWFYTFMVILTVMMLYSAILFIINTVKSLRKNFNVFYILAMLLGIIFMWVSFGVGFDGYEPISSIVCCVLGVSSFVMMGSKTSNIINQAYAESYMKSSIGQVITTTDLCFLECNEIAKNMYPKFKNYNKGEHINLEGEGIVFDKDAKKLYVNDRCYTVTYHKLRGNQGQIVTMTDISELENQRTHDELTGLLNRHAFYSRISRIMSSETNNINIMIADLNGLKSTNDNLGHAAGDALIQRAANCLSKAFDTKSHVFRFGGDEFVVFSTASAEEFTEMTIQLNKLIESSNQNADYLLSLSHGTAFGSGESIDIKNLMTEADELMYINKKKYYELNNLERRHV